MILHITQQSLTITNDTNIFIMVTVMTFASIVTQSEAEDVDTSLTEAYIPPAQCVGTTFY